MQAEKEKAAAIERSSRREVPSSTWTPTRSTRVNKEEKGEKGKIESFANRREMKEKDEGNREDMRRHAIYLRDTLPPSTFSIGSMSGTGVRVETPSHSSLVSPSIPSSSIVPPSSTRVPSVSTPMEKEKTVKKSAVSYEEYKKRKKEGEIISGEEKKDRNEKKGEVATKSFMTRADSSVSNHWRSVIVSRGSAKGRVKFLTKEAMSSGCVCSCLLELAVSQPVYFLSDDYPNSSQENMSTLVALLSGTRISCSKPELYRAKIGGNLPV